MICKLLSYDCNVSVNEDFIHSFIQVPTTTCCSASFGLTQSPAQNPEFMCCYEYMSCFIAVIQHIILYTNKLVTQTIGNIGIGIVTCNSLPEQLNVDRNWSQLGRFVR